MVDHSAQSLGGDSGTTVRAARTPEQALNLSRVLVGMFILPIVMLSGIAVLFTIGLSRHGAAQSDTMMLAFMIAGAGSAIALASYFTSRWMGVRAAKSWAEAGRLGSDVASSAAAPRNSKLFGMDVGPTAPVSSTSTLWDKFLGATIVGCAMAEMAALEAFVATIVSHAIYIMLIGILVTLTFMFLNFPRRSTWDDWAGSAGLTIPWK